MLQRPLGSRHDDDDVSGDDDEEAKRLHEQRPLIGKDELHCRRYNLQELAQAALRVPSNQELRHLRRKAPLVPSQPHGHDGAGGRKEDHDWSLAPGAPRLSPRSCPGCRFRRRTRTADTSICEERGRKANIGIFRQLSRFPSLRS